MPDEVKLKDELLSKDEAVVSLAEKLVEEVVILFDQLVQNVLHNCANFCHLEHFESALILHLLVRSVIESHIFHCAHLVSIFEGSAELPEYLVTDIDDELQVRSTALFIEDKDELAFEADPVEEHHSRSDQTKVFVLSFHGRRLHCLVVFVLLLDLI